MERNEKDVKMRRKEGKLVDFIVDISICIGFNYIVILFLHSLINLKH